MTETRKHKRRIIPELLLFTAICLSGCVDREILAELAPDLDTYTDIDILPADSDEEIVIDSDSDDSSGEEKILPEADCGGEEGIWNDSVFIDYAPELSALTADDRTVTHIAGSLVIDSVKEDPFILDELKSLRCIDGDLIIRNVPGLKTLKNLSRLWMVGRTVQIRENDALPTCEATVLYNRITQYDWDQPACIIDNLEDGCDGITTSSSVCSNEFRW